MNRPSTRPLTTPTIAAKAMAPPKAVKVPNVLGQMNEMPSPGYAEFTRAGQTIRLDGVLEESLHGGEIIDLGFAYRPAALGNSGVPSWS